MAIRLPGFAMIDCDDLGKGSDHVHYNAPGQIELGRRFANAWIAATKPGPATPAR